MTTIYPGSLDVFTDKTDGVDYNLASHINDLQDSVEAVEGELGTDPAGSYATGKDRLDDHAHAGGDGGQIDHVNLANIGSNSHTAIDTHLALARWATAKKTVSMTRNSTTTIANDPDLIFSMLANTKYAIRGKIFFETVAAADFKCRFSSGGSPTKVSLLIEEFNAGYYALENVFPTPTIISASTANFISFVEFFGIVYKEAADGNFVFQWAQNTSDAGDTTVLAGSYIEYMQM